jgi:hypothetical protein
MAIEYQVVPTANVNVDELLEFYEQQNHQTTESTQKLSEMLRRSAAFVTARDDGRLIGIARGITDGVRGYLTDCKLDPAYQGPAALTRKDGRIEHDEHGIGRTMGMRVLEKFREMGVEQVHAIAHGTEEDFCAELGFKRARGAVPMQLDLKAMALCQSAG